MSTLRDLVEREDARAAITAMLPPGVTLERVMREFYNAVADNPKIRQCEPGSIVRAIAKAASWDLVIGDTCYLIPRKGKLTALMGYRGQIELLMRNGVARFIDAQPVFSNEPFIYKQGTHPTIDHAPILSVKDRGEFVGAYAWARLTAYSLKICAIPREEIEQIKRDLSFEWKDQSLNEIPWYGCKTAVRRLAKQLPMSPKLARVFVDDDEDVIDGMLTEVDRIEAPQQKMLGAGPAEPIPVRRRPGATVPLSSNSLASDDPYGLDPIKAMQDAQVPRSE